MSRWLYRPTPQHHTSPSNTLLATDLLSEGIFQQSEGEVHEWACWPRDFIRRSPRVWGILESLDLGNSVLVKSNGPHGGKFYTVLQNGTSIENEMIMQQCKLLIINAIHEPNGAFSNVPFVSLVVVDEQYTTRYCVS